MLPSFGLNGEARSSPGQIAAGKDAVPDTKATLPEVAAIAIVPGVRAQSPNGPEPVGLSLFFNNGTMIDAQQLKT